MKISYQWLKRYLPVTCPPEELSGILTSIGLEVEGLERFETIRGGLDGMVIGQVLTCEKHPDSDHLSKTTVDIGNDIVLPIVCGAPNVAAGQKVVVATVGTTLYMNDQELLIKKAKIRGEVSEGMICAEDEIGIGTSHEGILVLDDLVAPGTPAREYFQIYTDDVFEIGLTPNRIDAASHYGVARDLNAYFMARDRNWGLIHPSRDLSLPFGEEGGISVEVEDIEACPVYCGLTIRDIRTAPSPEWLQNALKSIGMHPINNIVDISNFVLHELGQPLHIFNAEAISGNRVIVKTVPEGTEFITLDGVQRTLSGQDLMICNEKKPMCIGGVYGGLDSGVTDSVTRIFIESACFNPVMIRKTARRHGLNTDASFRFERGVDPNLQMQALYRAASLILELAGGKICGTPVCISAGKVPPFRVVFDLDWFDRFTGKTIERPLIQAILHALDINTEPVSETLWNLDVPPYRVDVTRPADIAEEILRIYGYNSIEISQTVHSSLSYQAKPDRDKVIHLVSDYLSSQGFFESMSNSLTQAAYYEYTDMYPAAALVKIHNPLSTDLGVMRQTLLFSGLEVLAYNFNRKQTDLRIFEFGNVYKAEEAPSQCLKGYTENQHLGLWVTGSDHESNWISCGKSSTFYTIKSYCEAVMLRLGMVPDLLQSETFSNANYSDAMRWFQGKSRIAECGVLRKNLLQRFGLKNPVYYACFDWDQVMNLLKKHIIQVKDLPKFPEVKRDLALLLDQDILFSRISKLAFKTEKKLLRRISLFDVYQGDKIPEGKKSYAVSFILRDDEKTLQDAEIDAAMGRLLQAFQKELGATLRG